MGRVMQRTILLVEDDEVFRYVTEAHLTAAGFAVVAAECGMAALKKLDCQPVDLLLADVHLPRGGPQGLSLAHMVKHRYGIPVIFVTGHRELLDAVAYIPGKVFCKPVDLDALTAEIVRQLSEQPQPQPQPQPSIPSDTAEQIRRWRIKAEELRTTSEGHTLASVRQDLKTAAQTYDALADRAEARLQGRRNRLADTGGNA